jgi:signal transduction histidine kinase
MSGRRKPPQPGFTVDTHLFRELGELLVGRDSTALLELIKNSYDADASQVAVFGQGLSAPEGGGYVTVSDDGTGMTPEEFQNGFLRIASRTKEQGNRRSRRFHRRYTGEKGVGRLAAHKLARNVLVRTVPYRPPGERLQLDASIDWDVIETYETLDEAADAIELVTAPVDQEVPNGTVIRLDALRRPWSQEELARFLGEAETFQPPGLLAEPLPRDVLGKRLLFERPTIRDVDSSDDPGFKLTYGGDFEEAGDYWDQILKTSQWVAEVRATRTGVRFAVAPTERERTAHPAARPETLTIPHASPDDGPFFEARIVMRQKAGGTASFREWSEHVTGIRVYLEGFRVLPYGEGGNDWLNIARDAGRRLRTFQALNLISDVDPDLDVDAPLSIAPPDSYVGAVFLTTTGAATLRMLVNREGFVPNESLALLARYTRAAVELIARARSAGRAEARGARRSRRRTMEADGTETPAVVQHRERLRNALEDSRETLAALRESVQAGDLSRANAVLSDLDSRIDGFDSLLDQTLREQALLPVLASIGTQMAEFIHEIRGLLGLAQTADRVLTEARQREQEGRSARGRIAEAHRIVGDLRTRLERQAAYLVDVVSVGGRRRRSRQPLAERFNAARLFVERPRNERRIRIENQIPPDLRSPPMYAPEIASVFVNLLTNAVKAVGKDGRVTATGLVDDNGHTRIRIENTGRAVPPSEGERWFQPFESTTIDPDPVLGHGMGLGLPITRAILEEYGARIAFVQPSERNRAAIEIDFGRS